MRRLALLLALAAGTALAADSSFNGAFPANGQAVGGKSTVTGRMLPFAINGATGALTTDVTQVTNPWTVAPTEYAQTAFGEARVASPYTLLDLVSKYGLDARALDTQVAGAGTVTSVTNESAVRLAVSGAAGDAARVRTNVYWRYQAGRGQRVLQTVYMDAAAGASANQTVRWGYFDAGDGLFWQRNNGLVIGPGQMRAFYRFSAQATGGACQARWCLKGLLRRHTVPLGGVR